MKVSQFELIELSRAVFVYSMMFCLLDKLNSSRVLLRHVTCCICQCNMFDSCYCRCYHNLKINKTAGWLLKCSCYNMKMLFVTNYQQNNVHVIMRDDVSYDTIKLLYRMMFYFQYILNLLFQDTKINPL